MVRVQQTLTHRAEFSTGVSHALDQSQRPAYRFHLRLGPLQKFEADCLSCLYATHRTAVPFFWDGRPYNALEEFALVGEADGTRTQFFLLNRYVDPNSISVQVTSGNGTSAIASVTVNGTPGVVTFTTIPASGLQVEARHAHRYKLRFGSQFAIRTATRGLFEAELDLVESVVSVGPRPLA